MQIPAVKTYFDSHAGVVTVSDDVLGVVQRIKAIDDRLMVFYNEQTDAFDIVERCLDGVDRLVTSAPALDQRVIDRLLLADHWGGNSTPERYITPDGEDFVTKMDQENDELEATIASGHREAVGEVGERLAHALELPLKGNGMAVFFPSERSLSAKDESGSAKGGTSE